VEETGVEMYITKNPASSPAKKLGKEKSGTTAQIIRY
jgi:hypothetical protein